MPTDAVTSPIAIREIDHIVLRVVDLARMLRFYGDVLGCREVRRQDEIGLVQLRAGSSMVDLIPIDGKLGAAGGAFTAMTSLAEGWRPWRAVAARILWHHYLSVRAERRASRT